VLTIVFESLKMNLRRILHTRTLTVLTYVGLALLVSSTSAFAQNGKIKAKVVDAKTGEPLIHATVQIIETKQGAYTKDDGFATIINVAPSQTYHVMAKYVSYKAVTQEDVVVHADETTPLTFKLSTTGGDTIVVDADRIMVSKTNTTVGRTFSAAQVQTTPGRQKLDEIIQLTPGIYEDAVNGGLSINGSKGTDNSIRINNVETTNPVTGLTSALQNGLSKFAISEIDVTTGGADASKGGAIGGIINTQTRSGGLNFNFQFHYRQDVPSLFGTSDNGYKQLGQNDRIYEVALGGPLLDNLSYFFTAKGETRQFDNYFTIPSVVNDGLDVRDPLGNSAGQLPHTNHFVGTITGKLAYQVSGFSLSADVDLGEENRQYNSVGTFYSDYATLPASDNIQNIFSINGTAQIGDGTLQFDGSYQNYSFAEGQYNTATAPTLATGLFKPYQIYTPQDNYTINNGSAAQGADGIIDIYTAVDRQIPNPIDPTQAYNLSGAGINPLTGHIEGPAISYSTANGYGLPGVFVVAGNTGGYEFDNNEAEQMHAHYSIQSGAHLLDFGGEMNIWHAQTESNSLPWDANPFKDSFDVHPYWGALFVIDKMEFSDITFQPSLRYDFYKSGANSIANLYNPVINGVTQLTPASLQSQLSPRLSITYAVTEQTTFNFDYGWYFKEPTLNDVLANTSGNIGEILSRGNQIIGNGSLQAENSREIDVGFSSQLNDVFAVTVNGVYKDVRNEPGLEQISSPFLPVGYTVYSSDEYGNVRELQLVLDKRMSNNYSARLNYTYSVSKGTSASAEAAYAALINASSNSQNTALPLEPFPLSYDRTHNAQFIFNLNYLKGEGPTLFGSKILQLFSFNSTTVYQSGVPYTKLDLRGVQVGEYNADREPSFFQTDCSLTRSIPFEDIFGESMKSFFLDLQIEVTNIFNTTDPITVYPQTGLGNNDGSSGTWLGTQEYYNNPTASILQQYGVTSQYDGLGKLLYNPIADLNHDGKVSLSEQQTMYTRLRNDQFATRTNYQAPRRVYFNVTLRF
jgi:hypothetical protein